MAKKPHWLPQDKWIELVAKYGGVPRCEQTGETDDLSVDHRVPRYHGGPDDVSNLQFLKTRLNCRKGVASDVYWSRNFYFDQMPNLDQCRAGQRGAFQELLAQADWFSQPLSNIARLLYLFAMVVGSGKTLLPILAACAYNKIIRAKWGAARRADRILILTKERSVRDQMARDIAKDLKKYGIMSGEPPRVKIVTQGYMLHDDSTLLNHDVFIACVHQLWEADVEKRKRLEELLHHFALIWIDEPHFAIDQVLAIIDMATTSLVMGGTGSPFWGAGKLLPRMINVYSFGYDKADERDKSMKYLSNDLQRHVHMAMLREATMLDHGKVALRNDTKTYGYAKNFEPAQSVIEQLILHMERCDTLSPKTAFSAPHRTYDHEVSIFYPIHALISTDNVPFANLLARSTNDIFEKKPERFPRANGWWCEVVHCEGEEPDGRKRADKPLTSDPLHPWLRCKDRPGYRIDGNCARILIVVGMAREGTNNPLCGVVGVCMDHASDIEAVQRILGRQIRSVTQAKSDGRLCVPPVELDTVTIITHEAFGKVTKAIEDAIDFVLDMDAKLEDMPTILTLQNGDDLAEYRPGEDTQPLPFVTKLRTAGALGSDGEFDGDDDIIAYFGGGNSKTEEKLRAWIKLLRDNPRSAWDQLGFTKDLASIQTVLRDEVLQDPDDDRLQQFLWRKLPHLARNPINDHNREHVRELFRRDACEVEATIPALRNIDGSERRIDDIRKAIGGSILYDLSNYYQKSPDNDRLLWQFVGAAVKQILGVPKDKAANNGTQWDCPQCHIVLERADVFREMRTWIIGRLIDGGAVPALAALYNSGE